MTDLSGRLAIITGGARGQGEAEARLFASKGAAVIIADVLAQEGRALAEALQSEGREARFIYLDVTDPTSWAGVVALATEWKGRIDILVNNAGIINRTIVETTSLEAWERVLKVNLTGAFLGQHIGNDDGRTLGGEETSFSLALATRTPGDDGKTS